MIKRVFSALFRSESAWMRWIMAVILIGYFTAQNTKYFEPIRTFLSSDSFTLQIGKARPTGFDILNGIITVLAVFWVASLIAVWIDKSIRGLEKVNSNTKSLVISGLKVLVFVIAAFVGLNSLGIDMSTLTVLSGAIGIGLGFGLQKITSNFISGIILLFEKSLEEGDLVEMSAGETGIVRRMGARFTLIETFDSKEIMIPNEDFITNRVINWTFTNKQGRIEILIGVSYDSDIELARELIIKAAKSHPRCSIEPEPQCHLTEFGDSSVNFLLYFWVDDITLGRLEPRSDVHRSIWRAFKENNISIPFPQSDVRIKNWDDKP